MQVLEILRHKGRDVVSLPGDASLSDATRMLATKRIGAVVVRDEQGSISGMLSE